MGTFTAKKLHRGLAEYSITRCVCVCVCVCVDMCVCACARVCVGVYVDTFMCEFVR